MNPLTVGNANQASLEKEPHRKPASALTSIDETSSGNKPEEDEMGMASLPDPDRHHFDGGVTNKQSRKNRQSGMRQTSKSSPAHLPHTGAAQSNWHVLGLGLLVSLLGGYRYRRIFRLKSKKL
ncbi:LPXTG cell wall anchor domain-containing protein [Levilactobacillus tongjiangensis]|uniref:LPXTG cell wall anchor domain-containing protein n=3 Tax=Levilactobacillus tongjiangensis TaxID=2486023 RepID=A0ABW1STT6_9LACO